MEPDFATDPNVVLEIAASGTPAQVIERIRVALARADTFPFDTRRVRAHITFTHLPEPASTWDEQAPPPRPDDIDLLPDEPSGDVPVTVIDDLDSEDSFDQGGEPIDVPLGPDAAEIVRLRAQTVEGAGE